MKDKRYTPQLSSRATLTLDQLRTDAKRYRKAHRELSLHEAQDIVAKQYDYRDFRHAKAELVPGKTAPMTRTKAREEEIGQPAWSLTSGMLWNILMRIRSGQEYPRFNATSDGRRMVIETHICMNKDGGPYGELYLVLALDRHDRITAAELEYEREEGRINSVLSRSVHLNMAEAMAFITPRPEGWESYVAELLRRTEHREG